jgi:hypothetical protein
LSRLGRDLRKIVIVDNIRDNFERQKENGIEVLTWLNDPKDKELLKLGQFFKTLVDEKVCDVRPAVMEYTKQKWWSSSKSKRELMSQNKENKSCKLTKSHDKNKRIELLNKEKYPSQVLSSSSSWKFIDDIQGPAERDVSRNDGDEGIGVSLSPIRRSSK